MYDSRFNISCVLQARSVSDNPGSAFRTVDHFNTLTTTLFPECVTLDDLFLRAVQLYGEHRCLGSRELISEEDEIQPNGKVFKKVWISSWVHCDVTQPCAMLAWYDMIVTGTMDVLPWQCHCDVIDYCDVTPCFSKQGSQGSWIWTATVNQLFYILFLLSKPLMSSMAGAKCIWFITLSETRRWAFFLPYHVFLHGSFKEFGSSLIYVSDYKMIFCSSFAGKWGRECKTLSNIKCIITIYRMWSLPEMYLIYCINFR